MLNLLHHTSCLGLLLLIAYPMTVNATQSYRTTELTVILKSSRPLPPDLVPVLYRENVYGQIHSLEYGLGTVTDMKSAAPSTFTAEVRWHQPDVALAIDHPGFLRGFSATLLLSEASTTHIVTLPTPGSLCANFKRENLEGDPSEYSNASSLTRRAPFTYKIEDSTQPLPGLELNYDDLAPGNYSIYAKISGHINFSIKSGHLTELTFPTFTGIELENSKPTSPTISIKPLTTNSTN